MAKKTPAPKAPKPAAPPPRPAADGAVDYVSRYAPVPDVPAPAEPAADGVVSWLAPVAAPPPIADVVPESWYLVRETTYYPAYLAKATRVVTPGLAVEVQPLPTGGVGPGFIEEEGDWPDRRTVAPRALTAVSPEHAVLCDLVSTINNTGGLVRGVMSEGPTPRVSDDWVDLGAAYLGACRVLGVREAYLTASTFSSDDEDDVDVDVDAGAGDRGAPAEEGAADAS